MTREELKVGALIDNIVSGFTVKVVQIEEMGFAYKIVYEYTRDLRPIIDSMMADDDELLKFSIAKAREPSFDANGDEFKLSLEACRIECARAFDPYLAVYSSKIEPLPHQVLAVYKCMLPKLPELRYLLADDPGSGKTIMAGLLIKELMYRGDVKRVLVVAPGSLTSQWQDEMSDKFDLDFELLLKEDLLSCSLKKSAFDKPLLIARMDMLSRMKELEQRIGERRWDIIICDEAHKMSASVNGKKVDYTKRYRLGQLLSRHARHFLLMTATPHNGKDEDFNCFMALLDADRFEGRKGNSHPFKVGDIMHRVVKEELKKFDGTKLFPPRYATSIAYTLGDDEKQLYEAVTKYVRTGFNKAQRLEGSARNAVGFALTILQRRLASSSAAIYQSLCRRFDGLSSELRSIKSRNLDAGKYLEDEGSGLDFDDMDEDDFSDEDEGEEAVFKASAARNIKELEAEIQEVASLRDQAGELSQHSDKKWQELRDCICDKVKDEKLIIFTEYKDTVDYLKDKIAILLGGDAVESIDGRMSKDDRLRAQNAFKENGKVQVLVATDAAGEGVNLQCAHLMVNYDLPWNPNRLEQRFGRIHRIGQNKPCHLWNLVTTDTREGAVYDALLKKLSREKGALEGKVFDVLGKIQDSNKALKYIMLEAIKSDDAAMALRNTQREIDSYILEAQKVLKEEPLQNTVLSEEDIASIKEEMAILEARKLEPYYMEGFFNQAFKLLKAAYSKMSDRGIYRIRRTPKEICAIDNTLSTRYDAICFDKSALRDNVTFVPPEHPLFLSLLKWAYKEEPLKVGAILVDTLSFNTETRLLYCVKTSIGFNSEKLKDDKVFEGIDFLWMDANSNVTQAGFAPYLSLDALEGDCQEIRDKILSESRDLIHADESKVLSYAYSNILKPKKEKEDEKNLERIERTTSAVDSRLIQQINLYDERAVELSSRKDADTQVIKKAITDNNNKAEELRLRRESRLKELEEQKSLKVLSPAIIARSLVVHESTIFRLKNLSYTVDLAQKKELELLAIKAVMKNEEALGFSPEDVSSRNEGYDLISRGQGSLLRFIEVKGRAEDATSVTVSRNEVNAALNKRLNYYLVIVKKTDNTLTLTYINRPFTLPIEASQGSANYDISPLLSSSPDAKDYTLPYPLP